MFDRKYIKNTLMRALIVTAHEILVIITYAQNTSLNSDVPISLKGLV